jgi:Cu/Ag efflux pump CusA
VAQAFLTATVTSLVVALVVAPVLATILLSGPAQRPDESAAARALERGYAALLPRLLRRPAWAYATVVVLAVVGLLAAPALRGTPLSPTLKERDLLLSWEAPAGTSLPEMNRITAALTAELRTVPGVRDVGAHIGRAIAGDQIVGINSGEVWLSIAQRADYDKTLAAVRRVVKGYPGVRSDLVTYSDKRIREAVTTSTSDDLVVRIYGNDYTVLNSKAQEVLGIISGIRGVDRPHVVTAQVAPTVEIEVSVDKAAKWGLKPGDVRRAAATLVAATVAGNLFDEQKVFEVVVWGAPQVRQNLDAIRDLRIDAPVGGPGGGPTQVRLADVADVRVVPKPEVILHDQVSRAIDVVANVRGRGIGAVTADVKNQLRQVTFPQEHHLEVLGEAQARTDAGFELWATVVGLAIFLFFLLQAAFGSWRLTLLYFLLLPLSLTGGALVAIAVRGSLSVVALLGLLTVLALAVRGGLLQVKQYQRLEDEGMSRGAELVALGSRQRFVPTVVGTLAAGLALVPMVVYRGAAGLEILGPMALIVLGGLVSTALLNLLVLPAMYLRFGARPRPGAQHGAEPAVDEATAKAGPSSGPAPA